jgi:Domain of unknown function (DUF4333)
MATLGDHRRRPARARFTLSRGAAALLVAAAGLAGCSLSPRRTLSTASVEAKIGAQLASVYHIIPPEVHCPKSVPATPGTRFTCAATLDGQPLQVVATVTGTHGHFEVHATSAVVVKSAAEAEISQNLSHRVGRPVSVSCPVLELLVADPGHTFRCTAEIAGVPRQVAVTVENLAGDLRYEVLPYKSADVGSAAEPTTSWRDGGGEGGPRWRAGRRSRPSPLSPSR